MFVFTHNYAKYLGIKNWVQSESNREWDRDRPNEKEWETEREIEGKREREWARERDTKRQKKWEREDVLSGRDREREHV